VPEAGLENVIPLALVNTNRVRPPIAPLGIEYLAEYLSTAGYEPDLLDLCWEEDWRKGMGRFFSGREYQVVGFSLRNTDDCAFSTKHSFLPEFLEMIRYARELSGAFFMIGGVGFSTMPEPILEATGVEAGVLGSGEQTTRMLLECLDNDGSWHEVQGLIHRTGGRWTQNAQPRGRKLDLPTMSRRWLDNPRYFREGGQAGVETKRGCPWRCIYCCEPLAKGSTVRTRPAQEVGDELASLLDQGIDHIHTCDSEFNLPPDHALTVCEEILRRGMGGRLRWYAYCTPAPFPRELAALMARSGCVGINFGMDSGDAVMLRRLGRRYGPEELLETVRSCREEGIVVMLDLLFGSPGESRDSVIRTVDIARESGAERIGISAGVRVWPGTPLAAEITGEELSQGLRGGRDPLDPLFFIEPSLGDEMFELLDRRIGGDERFFFFNPAEASQNYNYNDNEVLVNAILGGYRGAYWDILRRLSR
jgi:radical SAM superfamily enzyme YgiQ (UPF0313 family)